MFNQISINLYLIVINFWSSVDQGLVKFRSIVDQILINCWWTVDQISIEFCWILLINLIQGDSGKVRERQGDLGKFTESQANSGRFWKIKGDPGRFRKSQGDPGRSIRKFNFSFSFCRVQQNNKKNHSVVKKNW